MGASMTAGISESLRPTLDHVRAFWSHLDPDEQIGEEQVGRAIMAGALATAYLALSYAVSAFSVLLAGSQAPGSFHDPFDRLAALTVYTMLIAIPLGITLLVWKKRSMAAAWMGLGCAAADMGVNATQIASPRMAVSVVVVIAAIHGIRGIQASQRGGTAQAAL
jgi:hypothetical protein